MPIIGSLLLAMLSARLRQWWDRDGSSSAMMRTASGRSSPSAHRPSRSVAPVPARYRYVPANQRRGQNLVRFDGSSSRTTRIIALTKRAMSMTCRTRSQFPQPLGTDRRRLPTCRLTVVAVASMNVTSPLSPPPPPRCNHSSWASKRMPMQSCPTYMVRLLQGSDRPLSLARWLTQTVAVAALKAFGMFPSQLWRFAAARSGRLVVDQCDSSQLVHLRRLLSVAGCRGGDAILGRGGRSPHPRRRACHGGGAGGNHGGMTDAA